MTNIVRDMLGQRYQDGNVVMTISNTGDTRATRIGRGTDRALSAIEGIFMVVAGIVTVCLMLVIAVSAISRYIFSSPLSGSQELVSIFMMPLVAFFAVAATLRMQHHVGMTFVITRLSPIMRRVSQSLAAVITAAIFVIVGYQGLLRAASSLESGQVDSQLHNVPLFLAYVVVPIGSFLVAARALVLCGNWWITGAHSPTLAQDPASIDTEL